MGKRGGSKKTQNSTPLPRTPITLRDEATGKKQNKTVNVKSKLKNEHLQKLAAWASSEASIPSLAAFFGNRLAADAELSGIPPDPSLFSCQRCETILQPGFNCTVRIEKNRAKPRNRRKKLHNLAQNNVVFNCHFCSHRNLKRGTPKGHMKDICPPKIRPPSISKKSAAKDQEKPCKVEDTMISSPEAAQDEPATPVVRTGRTLDGNKRKRNKSGTKRPVEFEGSSDTVNAGNTVEASGKKKRKSWMSLKEIAESNEKSNGRNIGTSSIPFLL